MSEVSLDEREVFYSNEDKGWIAVAPEFPGCSAFGRTKARALKELASAIEVWLESSNAKRWSAMPVAAKKLGGRCGRRSGKRNVLMFTGDRKNE